MAAKTGKLQYHGYELTSYTDIGRTRLPSIRPEDTEYNPRDHRVPKERIKLWMAYLNLLRSLCGAGILGMPLVVSHAGILMGPILIMCTGLLLIHTYILLLDSLNEVCRQLKTPFVSFRYGFRLAVLHGPPIFHCIGHRGPGIIAAFVFLSQLGICTVFITTTSECLRDLMDWQSVRPALIALLFPYVVLEFFMKSLWIVSHVSMWGNYFNIIGLIMILYQIFDHPNREGVSATTTQTDFLIAFGTILFHLSAVAVILTLDEALVEAYRMTTKYGVIPVGVFVPTVLSIIFGCLGYWSFGIMEDNILRALPFDELETTISLGVYIIATIFAFPIQCHPAVKVIVEVIKYHDPMARPSDRTLEFAETMGRPLFVMLCFLVGYFTPVEGPVVALVGNLCTTMLSLIFPALMDICLRYPELYGPLNILLFKDLLIISVGLAVTGFGLYYCGYLMYIRVLEASSPTRSGYF